MEFLEAIAGLLGITVTELVVISAITLALVVGWYILKTVVKITARIFAVGCITIIAVVAALYVVFVVIGAQ